MENKPNIPARIARYVLIAVGLVVVLAAAYQFATGPGQPWSAPAAATAAPPTETAESTATAPAAAGDSSVEEHAILPIALSGPGSQAEAEISGLGWYGNILILLPQYPQRMAESAGGALLGLPRDVIAAYLEARAGGGAPAPLEPQLIQFNSGGIERSIAGFEGFESIAFSGDRAYLTIEASAGNTMKSYLVRGQMSADGSAFTLDAAGMVEAPLKTQISNFSNEAILVDGERLLLFFEANGVDANPAASALVYSLDLQPQGELALPHLEYRLTDATAPDESGRFWVSNYFYLGDVKILPQNDPLAEQWGQGASHAQSPTVERLVALELPAGEGGALTLADTPPLQIELDYDQASRNWEGLVRFDDAEQSGFLLVTDKYPETILAFLAVAEGER